GEGEEVRVSERSEFPHRPSTDRGAQGTDAQHRLAPRRRVSLVTFFARAKKVTPLRGRGNDPALPMRGCANKNGTFAGAVSKNRVYA
ncbi:hypothetical protein, partial [Stenotrophomonas sp. CR043]